MTCANLYAVSVYDSETETLSLTKELAPSKLVAARVALANFCVDSIEHHVSFLDLQTAMRDLGLEVGVLSFLDA